MNGASGFREVRSSTSRLPSYRFLQEQRHRFGTGSWQLHVYDLTALSKGISTKPKSFLTSFLRAQEQVMGYVEVPEEAIHSSSGNVVHELCMEARLG